MFRCERLNLGVMSTRATIEAISNRFLKIENVVEMSVLTRAESQIADGLAAGINSFSGEYGVEVWRTAKKLLRAKLKQYAQDSYIFRHSPVRIIPFFLVTIHQLYHS